MSVTRAIKAATVSSTTFLSKSSWSRIPLQASNHGRILAGVCNIGSILRSTAIHAPVFLMFPLAFFSNMDCSSSCKRSAAASSYSSRLCEKDEIVSSTSSGNGKVGSARKALRLLESSLSGLTRKHNQFKLFRQGPAADHHGRGSGDTGKAVTTGSCGVSGQGSFMTYVDEVIAEALGAGTQGPGC